MFELKDIKVERDGRTILDIGAMTLDTNAFTVILGHNGSGKSTLLNLLARQWQPNTGDITLDNKAISNFSQRELAKKVAYLPQSLPEVAGLTVKELVRLGRFPWRGTFGRWRREDTEIINESMLKTDVMQYQDTLADQLSGGERQRAWIAMLLAQMSPVLLLDEPTSALDLSHQYDLMQLLKKLNQETGKGVVVVLHDINLALRFADKVVALRKGKIFMEGQIDLLLDQQKLSELYDIPVQILDLPQGNRKVVYVS